MIARGDGVNDISGLVPVEESTARGWAPYFITSARCWSGRALHVPGPESTRDDPKPLCGNTAAEQFLSKDVDVFPPGYIDLCRSCRRYLRKKGVGGGE